MYSKYFVFRHQQIHHILLDCEHVSLVYSKVVVYWYFSIFTMNKIDILQWFIEIIIT